MPIWACLSMSRSRREVTTVHQRIDVALSGDLLDVVLGDELGDQFVVGLESGQFLLGELAPLGADGIQHIVAVAVLRACGIVRRGGVGHSVSCCWLAGPRKKSIERRLQQMGTMPRIVRSAADSLSSARAADGLDIIGNAARHTREASRCRRVKEL